ncbi:MAG: hypothetical protein ABIS47_03760 [Acidimicrobiales bacterium]
MVVLTVGLAAFVLVAAAVGLRAAGGRGPKGDEVVEVPARSDPLPSTTAPGSTDPGSGPSGPTTAPGRSTVPLDATTPKLTQTDADGRFEITVPRSWVSLPALTPDSTTWQLFDQVGGATPAATGFQFAVAWFDSKGRTLEECAAAQVDAALKVQPSLSISTTPSTVGSQPAARFEVALADRRFVNWVVVRDDRYWVMQLAGPPDGFDDVLPVVERVLATMSFGR